MTDFNSQRIMNEQWPH